MADNKIDIKNTNGQMNIVGNQFGGTNSSVHINYSEAQTGGAGKKPDGDQQIAQEIIDTQVALLTQTRRTLAIYLKQQAAIGVNLAPAHIINGIQDARREINRLKLVLQGWNVPVTDLPDDKP